MLGEVLVAATIVVCSKKHVTASTTFSLKFFKFYICNNVLIFSILFLKFMVPLSMSTTILRFPSLKVILFMTKITQNYATTVLLQTPQFQNID